MKNYREIADSVFARRDQYVIAQRKKKQAITRVTASVGSVALVSLAGIALFNNDAFRDAPPVTDGGATTTVTVSTTDGVATVTTAPSATGGDTTDTAATDAPTQTVTTAPTTTRSKTTATTVVPTSAPTKTEPSKTTATTTATPKKVLIGASEPDTHNVGNANEGPGYFKRGEISPMLKEKMETHKDENVVFAVLVAVMPKFSADDIDKAVSEFCETEEMKKLAEENNWKEYENRVHDFRDTCRQAVLKEELDVLYSLSEIEPIKYLLDPEFSRYNPEAQEPVPYLVNLLAHYSYGAHHIYSVVLSADAIYELSERGSYMFWLDSPDTINEKIPLMFDE